MSCPEKCDVPFNVLVATLARANPLTKVFAQLLSIVPLGMNDVLYYRVSLRGINFIRKITLISYALNKNRQINEIIEHDLRYRYLMVAKHRYKGRSAMTRCEEIKGCYDGMRCEVRWLRFWVRFPGNTHTRMVFLSTQRGGIHSNSSLAGQNTRSGWESEGLRLSFRHLR